MFKNRSPYYSRLQHSGNNRHHTDCSFKCCSNGLGDTTVEKIQEKIIKIRSSLAESLDDESCDRNNQLADYVYRHSALVCLFNMELVVQILICSCCYVHTIYNQESSVECYKYNGLDKAVSHKLLTQIPFHSIRIHDIYITRVFFFLQLN